MDVTDVLFPGVVLGLLCWLLKVVLTSRGSGAEPTKLHLSPQLPHQEPVPQPVRSDPSSLYRLASELSDYYRSSAHPEALLNHPTFLEGVALLNGGGYSGKDLVTYYHGDSAIVACMALEAYARRSDREDVRDKILANINGVVPWTRYFALRALSSGTPGDEPLVGRVLRSIDVSWKNPLGMEFLRDFIDSRLAGGEVPDFKADLQRIPDDHAEFIKELLEGQKGELASRLLAEFKAWRSTRIDMNFLGSIGHVWNWPEAEADPAIENEALLAQVATVQGVLLKDRPRSVLLVGETGVGKSTIVRVVGNRLQAKGWVIFEAGHTELIAGKVFIGELEERLRKLLHHLGGKRKILWYFPDFHAISWAGRHQHSSTSALDYFLPHIEQGEILILGETQPLAYEKLIQAKPRCRTAMEVCRVQALPENATKELARQWSGRHSPAEGPELASEETLREAWQLTQQYLGERSAPGNLLQFLKLTRERLSTGEVADRVVITINELILTLTQLTGLPASILDDRQSLDLKGLRGFFEKRVLGQPEAVECLVDRIAMIKAGVADPTRPQGVFLFVGPTGTGKTEIAKALGEYLFGSPSRMIRLDMSEFHEPESLERVLGDASRPSAGSLIDLIRKQPFSAVLLDEFEKAHPRIWDLFLQVFDDGRLTDRSGITADFRHAIIIMTSNLGGTVPSGTSLGFSPDSSKFSPAAVDRAVKNSFRKEFLNRIDRIVVFRPLSRDTMREILRKELDEVFHRRGLRNRAWAVEWDEAAIEFLLEKGFTSDLGARPLKRAIERYLLSPLATAIVNRQFPEGDQFLFVRSDGGDLTVEFVDPDAVEDTTFPASGYETVAVTQGAVCLENIALDAVGTASEMACLRSCHERLSQILGAPDWHNSKQASLSLISSPDFWNAPDRFGVLGDVEYMDRIESGFGAASSLLKRLTGNRATGREHFPRDLMKRLAQKLYLLEKACSSVRSNRPTEAFLLVQAGRDSGVMASLNDEFALKLGRMYRGWAKNRRMQIQLLEEAGGDAVSPYRLLLAISGFAAFSILELENGLHILEIPEEEGKSFKRCKVQVRVVPQPDEPAGPGLEAIRQQAIRTLDSHGLKSVTIVRRYRESPSPLVRDSVRGWRTGKLDRVLEGDFDLIVEREGEP